MKILKLLSVPMPKCLQNKGVTMAKIFKTHGFGRFLCTHPAVSPMAMGGRAHTADTERPGLEPPHTALKRLPAKIRALPCQNVCKIRARNYSSYCNYCNSIVKNKQTIVATVILKSGNALKERHR